MNHGVQIPLCEGAIFTRKGMPGHARLHSAVSCTKMAELIEMPFGLWTSSGPEEACVRWWAHWRHLANTIGLSVCGGDAA